MGQLNTILTKTRVSHEPVITHLEYNWQLSKWGLCYTKFSCVFILVDGWNHHIQFWKWTTQWPVFSNSGNFGLRTMIPLGNGTKSTKRPKSELFFYLKSDYDELFHQILEHDREMNRPFAHKPTLILELRICDYSYSLPSGQTWYLPLQCTNHTIFIYFFSYLFLCSCINRYPDWLMLMYKRPIHFPVVFGLIKTSIRSKKKSCS